MEGVDFLHVEQWSLKTIVGIHHPIFALNKETIIYTWAVLAIILFIGLLFRYILIHNQFWCFVACSYAQFFIQTVEQSLPRFIPAHFYFVIALFTFIFLSNVVSIIPFLDEPTKDLNTAFALGLVSFFYTQWVGIRKGGIKEYIKGYFKPFFIMLPLNLLGKFSTILSLSIRLFGNIFGSSIISGMYFTSLKGIWWAELFGMLTGLNFGMILFFTIFEGFLQAFVFTTLSLTYVSLSVQGEGH